MWHSATRSSGSRRRPRRKSFSSSFSARTTAAWLFIFGVRASAWIAIKRTFRFVPRRAISTSSFPPAATWPIRQAARAKPKRTVSDSCRARASMIFPAPRGSRDNSVTSRQIESAVRVRIRLMIRSTSATGGAIASHSHCSKKSGRNSSGRGSSSTAAAPQANNSSKGSAQANFISGRFAFTPRITVPLQLQLQLRLRSPVSASPIFIITHRRTISQTHLPSFCAVGSRSRIM